MATETTTIDICDRCGSRHNRADYTKGNSWGQLNLTWSGDMGGRAWDGAAGGTSVNGKAWLCLQCMDDFLHFMRPVHRVELPKGGQS